MKVYLIKDATESGILKFVSKQKKINKETAFFVTAFYIYICFNEVRAYKQRQEIEKLKKEIEE